ncbi:hypothetical protein Vadar_017844 [Vaccinium darrowii]|uniref:Uncharacterized protein n=1 Tax=Vaccinium darrowii TaxID=229202 RepID=A0ACB7Z4Q9_9ERIC|nr:hypothetical protein Vadar_017844 [Vaccinium darrowii]
MSSSSPFLLLFLLSIALHFHQPLVIVSGDTDLIQRTCKCTKYYDLCVSSLKSNPTSPKADTKSLAMIMAGVGIANATATASFLSSKVLNIGNDTSMRKAIIKDCADKYSYAVNALQSSIQDLIAEANDYAYMHVMAAADYPNACHNGFKRFPGLAYPPELVAREDGLKHICDVVLSIINLLGW